jgi:hypothetical protein
MKKQSAVTMVEAVIVIPLALGIICGLMYFGLLSVLQGVAESAAHRALDLAISLPELENIPADPKCGDTHTNCEDIKNNDFCRGICKVKEEALSLPQNSFFKKSKDDSFLAYFSQDVPAVNINIEHADDFMLGQSSQQAYNERPIIIEINYMIKSILPGGSESAKKVVASGFRESQSSFSYPIKVDCMGEPYDSPTYNPQRCQCKNMPAPQGWPGPGFWQGYGFAKQPYGGDKCKLCPKDSIPYYGDKNYDFYTSTWEQNEAECSQIAGRPEGYTCPVDGCWCPTQAKCQEIKGPGGVVMNDDSWDGQCTCVCNNWYGYNDKTDGTCGCDDQPPEYRVLQGPTGKSVTFAAKKEISAGRQNGDFAGVCSCMIDKDTDGNAVHRVLTDEDCDKIYPGGNGKRVANLNGCGCGCGYGLAFGTKFEATGQIVLSCDPAIFPHQYLSDFNNNCDCTCPGKTTTDGVHPCACPAPNAADCGGTMNLANVKMADTTCACICDPNKCVNGNYDSNCNCDCSWGGSPPNCRAEWDQDE